MFKYSTIVNWSQAGVVLLLSVNLTIFEFAFDGTRLITDINIWLFIAGTYT